MNIEDSIEILKNSKKLYLKEKIDSDILEEAIETLLTAYEKEKEENKLQPDYVEPVEKTEEMVNMRWVNHRFISKDKLKEILGIEETDSEKILSLLQTIVDENARLEELKENNGYHLGFIDGGIAKKYEYQDKIKAKIEEVKDGTYDAKIVLQSLLEKE